LSHIHFFFFFQAEDGIRDFHVTWSSDVCSSDLPARLLDRFEVGPEAFRADPDGVLEDVLLRRHSHAERFGRAAGELEELFQSLLREVDGIDPTLAGTVRRGRHHLELTLKRLRGRTAAALAR